MKGGYAAIEVGIGLMNNTLSNVNSNVVDVKTLVEGQGGYAKELALLRLSVSEEVGLLRDDVARLSEEVKKYNAKYLGQADDYRRTQGELALCKAESGRFRDEFRDEMRRNMDEMDERIRKASSSGVQANLDRTYLQEALTTMTANHTLLKDALDVERTQRLKDVKAERADRLKAEAKTKRKTDKELQRQLAMINSLTREVVENNAFIACLQVAIRVSALL